MGSSVMPDGFIRIRKGSVTLWVRKDLMEQLGNMPDAPKDWLATKSRQRSLERLARRLLEETDLRHGS